MLETSWADRFFTRCISEPIDQGDPPLEVGDHAEIARVITERLLKESAHSESRFWDYEPELGIWKETTKAQLGSGIQMFSQMPVGRNKRRFKVSAQVVRGSIQCLSDLLDRPRFFEDVRPAIVFRDKTIALKEGRLVPQDHSPEFRARFAHDFDYEPDAEPARLLEFFDQVFRDDGDRDQKVAVLQEFLGIAMLGLATKYHKSVVLVGDGRNGKGVCTQCLRSAMPPGSVCAIAPQDMDQEYRRAMLAGKLLNLVNEMPEDDIMKTSTWKAAVAGDDITGRHIRGEPFTFQPVAGHLYACNQLPGTTDHSAGYWERLIVVEFNRTFEQHERDPNLAEKIITEDTRHIVPWVLRGAQRVLERAEFTIPESSTTAIGKWRKTADQVCAFVEERLQESDQYEQWIGASKLYENYRTWAQENGHRGMARNKFGERMRLLGHKSRKVHGVNKYPFVFRELIRERSSEEPNDLLGRWNHVN